MALIDTTQLALHRAMTGTSLRQEAIAGNLANANTAGYQRQDVDFHSALRGALDSGADAVKSVRIAAQADGTAPLRLDGSNVDIDKEQAALAANGLEQEALASVSKARLEIIKIAMGVR